MIRSVSALFAMFTAAPAMAQTTVTLMHDNDEWAHTEQEYASGSRLSIVSVEWGGPLRRRRSLVGCLAARWVIR